MTGLCGEFGFREAAYYRLTRFGAPVAPTLAFGAGFEPWLRRYIEKRYVAIDPVIPMAFRRDLPFTAREVQAQSPEPAGLHAERRSYWAEDGVFCPVATSWSETGVLCWASEREVRLAPDDRLAMGNVSRAMVTQFKQLAPVEAMPQLPLRPLSRREAECTYWMAEGQRANEIAGVLGLSVHTVRQYIDSAVRKLGAKNRGDILLRASALGLISQPGSVEAATERTR